jgi:hypothetical protein
VISLREVLTMLKESADTAELDAFSKKNVTLTSAAAKVLFDKYNSLAMSQQTEFTSQEIEAARDLLRWSTVRTEMARDLREVLKYLPEGLLAPKEAMPKEPGTLISTPSHTSVTPRFYMRLEDQEDGRNWVGTRGGAYSDDFFDEWKIVPRKDDE